MNSLSPSLSITQAWIIVAAISILIFLINIDYTAVNLALVSISDEIDASLNSLQWLLSAYVLTWAALVVPCGKLADIYGQRTMLVLGVGLFILGSLLTGLGLSIEILILGRVIQGMGAAIFTPPCYTTIFSVMPNHKQGAAMGAIIAAGGLGLSTGPTLAGFILKYLSWRWIFYINIPLGIFVIFYIILFVPKDQHQNSSIKIDHLNVILLSSGLASMLFALNQIEVWGLKSPLLWGVSVIGLIALVSFWKRDGQNVSQMVPRHFLKNPTLIATIATISMTSFNFSLILVMIGLYLQNVLCMSHYQTGITFLWMTLTIGGLSPIGGKLADKINMRILTIAGLILMGSANLLMNFLGISSSLIYVCTCLCIAGMGCGLCFPALNTTILRSVSSADVNTATGLFTMTMMLGNSLGVIVATSLLVGFGRIKLDSLLSTSGLNLTAREIQKLEVLIAQADLSAIHFKDFSTTTTTTLLKIVKEAFVYGLSYNMLIGMTLSIIAIIITYTHLENLKANKTQGYTSPTL